MGADKISVPDKEIIVSAIKAAEKETSGEIQVHIDNHCKEEVLDRAAFMFKTLKMHQTKERNGVLFYMALKDHKFALIGDAGINEKVADDFWEQIKTHMATLFKDGKIAQGMSEGIKMAGEQLAIHFPYRADDENELSDEISFGKD